MAPQPPGRPRPELSIVVLSWNVAALLAGCLESLEAACGDWWSRSEVVVVDNASTDRSVPMVRSRFPYVRLLALGENRGFTGGNNAGIRAARGDLIFLLNPDTVAHPGSIALMAGYLSAHPHVGIVGPRLLNPDGTLQHSRRRFPTLLTSLVESTPLQPLFRGASFLRRFYMLDTPEGEVSDVDWLSGAALMCRRSALSQVGLFDPGYFMFSEEVDLCRRMVNAGWRVTYLPGALVTHYGGQSTGQDVPSRHIYFNTGKARYMRLYEGRVIGRLVRAYLLGMYAAQIFSEAAKWLAGHKRSLRAERVRLYLQVLRTGLRERKRPANDVLMITGEYPPARGGVGDYTCRLCSALERGGLRIRVLTRLRGLEDEGSGTPRLEARDAARVPLLVRRVTPGNTLRALRGTGTSIAHIQYQTGAYEMRPTVNLLPLLLRLRRHRRTVVTFHDLRVPYLFPKAGPLRTWAVRLLALGAQATVATNPEDASKLSQWGVRNVQTIPIGSNIPCDPPPGYSREGWRGEHGTTQNTVLLAYFGFLNSTKGLDDLLYALKSLQTKGDFRLVMVGGGLGSSDPTNRATASALASLARQLEVESRIIWTGYLDAREVSAALLASDIAVLPYADGASFRRGSLLAVLAHGLPLVTTHPAPDLVGQVGWPSLRNGENASLVAPGDREAIAAAVERIALDGSLKARLSKGSRQLALFFSWDTIADRHRTLYNSL